MNLSPQWREALLPIDIGDTAVAASKQFESSLLAGAVIVINDSKTRAGILSLGDQA